MNNFQKVWNDHTKQYDLQSQVELVSVAEAPMPNSNGKLYYPCTVKYTDPNGQVVNSQAIIHAKNYDKGMTVGTSYLATFIQTDQGVLITVSALTQAARPDANAFKSLFAQANAKTEAEARQAGAVI
jgi:hypothetical protein